VLLRRDAQLVVDCVVGCQIFSIASQSRTTPRSIGRTIATVSHCN
jgi:hypothetical protein